MTRCHPLFLKPFGTCLHIIAFFLLGWHTICRSVERSETTKYGKIILISVRREKFGISYFWRSLQSWFSILCRFSIQLFNHRNSSSLTQLRWHRLQLIRLAFILFICDGHTQNVLFSHFFRGRKWYSCTSRKGTKANSWWTQRYRLQSMICSRKLFPFTMASLKSTEYLLVHFIWVHRSICQTCIMIPIATLSINQQDELA